MPIGIGAAMLIGSAVSAGTSVAAAKMQSSAAKNAARDQQRATDQALAVNRQAQQPYMDVGAAAAQRLGQMGANFQPYTQVFGNGAGAQPFQMPPGPQGPPPGMPPGGPMGQGGPPPGSLAGVGGPGMQRPMGQALMGQGAPMGPTGAPSGGGAQGMIAKVMSPRGQVVDVPMDRLSEALANGGRRVG